MHSIRIHQVMALIITIFYRIGFWHRGDQPTVKERRTKLFYCIYHSLFLLSLAVGAITNAEMDDSIFLAEVSMGVLVVCIKLWMLLWKQSEILKLLNRVCVFSIRNDDDYNHFNHKLKEFSKFAFTILIIVTVSGSLASVILTLREKTLFFEIAFPLDYKSNDVAFWIAFVFLSTEVLLTILIITFTIIIWYLLFICSLRYEVQGNELRNMGGNGKKTDGKVTKRQLQNLFLEDLKASVNAHLNLHQLANEVESFFSGVFFIQFGTSGLCICGSIYCLAFDIGNNLFERMVHILAFFYFNSELFMITYFGNEIMLKSDRLSYSLFESYWYDQPKLTRKCIMIFGEHLKCTQKLVIGKLYPVTLETFTRILNSAYSMFNILKSFQ